MYLDLFILAQIVGFFSLVLYCVSMQLNNRIKLLILLLLVNLLNAIVYFLLGSIAGGVVALVSVLRLVIFSYYVKLNKNCPLYILFFFIVLEIFVGYITYDYWYDILCVLEAIIVAYGTYIKNMTITRICHLFSCILMFTFNIFVLAYSNMLSEFIGLIFTFIGIIRLDILPKVAPEVFEKNIIFATFIRKTKDNVIKPKSHKLIETHHLHSNKTSSKYDTSTPQIKNVKR